MTEFRYSLSLAAILLLNGNHALANLSCTASPDCTSLGYSQTAAECSGKAAVKCPFDISKMYCKKTPVVEGCTVGSFIYTDKSCSDTYDKTRTLVGVVFDPVKKLAVMSGFILPAAFEKLTYNSDLEFCPPATTLTTCGTDGKINTRKIFRKQASQYPERNPIFGTSLYASSNIVLISGSYSPISSSLWYGRNHWFIPSLKELDQIYNNLTAINNSFSKISSSNFPIPQATYHSSTFNDNLNLFVYNFKTGEKKIIKTSNASSLNNFLPIINYGDTSPVLNCTAEGTTDINTNQPAGIPIDSEGCYIKCKSSADINTIRTICGTNGFYICAQTSPSNYLYTCCTSASSGCSH